MKFYVVKRICCITAIFIWFFSLSALAQEKVFTAGWETWHPHQYKDDKGNIAGIDVELANAIFEHAGYKVKFVEEIPWKRHLLLLEKGKIDIAMGTSKNADREEYAYFTIPYTFDYNSMFVRTGEKSKYSFKSLKDIIGTNFKLGINRGWSYSEEFDALLQNEQFKERLEEVTSDEQNVEKLLKNRIDGFLASELAALSLLKSKSVSDQATVLMRLYGEEESVTYIMCSKKSFTPEQIAKLNEGIKAIFDNGTYQKIIDKYIK